MHVAMQQGQCVTSFVSGVQSAQTPMEYVTFQGWIPFSEAHAYMLPAFRKPTIAWKNLVTQTKENAPGLQIVLILSLALSLPTDV